MLPCLEIAADLIQGGEKEVNKIKQIPLSDTTVAQRCAVISADIKEQLIQKILKASSFGIQLNKNTDITIGGQYRVQKYRGTFLAPVLRLILGSLKVFFASIATCFCFSYRL